MAIKPLALSIRSKITGTLIRDARLAANKTTEECAKAIDVSTETFEDYELGNQSISLPELEGMAYFLEVPMEHFWRRETFSEDEYRRLLPDMKQLLSLRHRMIGALLRQARLESDLSLEALSTNTNIDASLLEAYELGQQPVPLPVLEMLSGVLNRSIREFQDQYGPVGDWNIQQNALRDFLNLPPEMQNFVSKPINYPYLELAVRLSEMSVDKLRDVAEGLLEITY